MALVVKNLPANTGDVGGAGLIPGRESPGGGHGNPLQYSCLENPMDRGAWWATVHEVTKSWTRSDLACMHAGEQKWSQHWAGVGRGVFTTKGSPSEGRSAEMAQGIW